MLKKRIVIFRSTLNQNFTHILIYMHVIDKGNDAINFIISIYIKTII